MNTFPLNSNPDFLSSLPPFFPPSLHLSFHSSCLLLPLSPFLLLSLPLLPHLYVVLWGRNSCLAGAPPAPGPLEHIPVCETPADTWAGVWGALCSPGTGLSLPPSPPCVTTTRDSSCKMRLAGLGLTQLSWCTPATIPWEGSLAV